MKSHNMFVIYSIERIVSSIKVTCTLHIQYASQNDVVIRYDNNYITYDSFENMNKTIMSENVDDYNFRESLSTVIVQFLKMYVCECNTV